MQPQIALYEPEIPGNAGAVGRLCAATGAPLHLIGRLGFSFLHPEAKRAGMDYWDHVEQHRHIDYDDFIAEIGGRRVWMMTTKAATSLWQARSEPGDVFLFGPESRGLPDEVLRTSPETALRIPMRDPARSLNLATSVAITLYEALRQMGGDAGLR